MRRNSHRPLRSRQGTSRSPHRPCQIRSQIDLTFATSGGLGAFVGAVGLCGVCGPHVWRPAGRDLEKRRCSAIRQSWPRCDQKENTPFWIPAGASKCQERRSQDCRSSTTASPGNGARPSVVNECSRRRSSRIKRACGQLSQLFRMVVVLEGV